MFLIKYRYISRNKTTEIENKNVFTVILKKICNYKEKIIADVKLLGAKH